MNIRTIVKKMTFFCFQQLKSNWQTGKWEKKTLSIRDQFRTKFLHSEILAMDNDFLLFGRQGPDNVPENIQMIDLRTMEFKPIVIHKLE